MNFKELSALQRALRGKGGGEPKAYHCSFIFIWEAGKSPESTVCFNSSFRSQWIFPLSLHHKILSTQSKSEKLIHEDINCNLSNAQSDLQSKPFLLNRVKSKFNVPPSFDPKFETETETEAQSMFTSRGWSVAVECGLKTDQRRDTLTLMLTLMRVWNVFSKMSTFVPGKQSSYYLCYYYTG